MTCFIIPLHRRICETVYSPDGQPSRFDAAASTAAIRADVLGTGGYFREEADAEVWTRKKDNNSVGLPKAAECWRSRGQNRTAEEAKISIVKLRIGQEALPCRIGIFA